MPVTLSRCARLYQERRIPEDRATRRGPGPQLNLADNPLHERPLTSPLPLPELLAAQNGTPPPDAGLTEIWPHGLPSED